MILCVNCKCLLKPSKNGVYVELKQEDNEKKEQPYKIFQADLKKCPRCGMEVICDFGYAPAHQHFQPDFKKARETILKSGVFYEEKLRDPRPVKKEPEPDGPILSILKGVSSCLINGKYSRVVFLFRHGEWNMIKVLFEWEKTKELNFHQGGFIEVVCKNGESYIFANPLKLKFINPGDSEFQEKVMLSDYPYNRMFKVSFPGGDPVDLR